MRRRTGEGGFSLVELLVTMTIMGIVAAGVMSTVVTTQRAEVREQSLQEVMDDGRLSMDRIRTQLRGGRRVLTGSTPQRLDWWSDVNQDGVIQPAEVIHFCVADLGSTTCKTTTATGRFQLVRWTDATSQASAATVAGTLVRTDVFGGFVADDPLTPTDEIEGTQTVTVQFELETDYSDNPSITLEADVRLRNVE